MRVIALILIAGFVGAGLQSFGAVASQEHTVQQASSPAADMVHNLKMGRNLEQIANQAAAMTLTSRMVDAAMLRAEIRRLLPKYQPQWDANLAEAYAGHLAPDELSSLAQQGSASPNFAKLRQHQAAAGVDMRSTSTSILEALVAEALHNVYVNQP